MRVAVLSDFETQGGAAVATSRALAALAARGHEIHRIVCRPLPAATTPHPWHTHPLHWRTCRSTSSRVLRKLLPAAARQRSDQIVVERALESLLAKIKPDVIDICNIHSALSGGWSDRLLPLASKYAPLCWTMYDMWSFTGRCAYAHSCARFIGGCNAQCPTAQEYPALAPELISPAWLARRAIFNQLPALTAVAPSRWLAAQARDGLWSNHRVEVIHTGLNLANYQLRDQRECRSELKLSPPGPLFLAVAVDWQSPHKGAALLLDALRSLADLHPTLLLLGNGDLPGDTSALNIVRLGFSTSDDLKSAAMAAADCLLHPATAENFSNVLLEAAACGLPVAAFDIGGNAEIVSHASSGFLAPTLTGAALADAARSTLALAANSPYLRAEIRGQAEQRFNAHLQAQQYEALYAELIAAWRTTRAPQPAA